jgi:hypothetical protein
MGRDSGGTSAGPSIVWYDDATVYVEIDDGSAACYGSFALTGGGEHAFLVTYDGSQSKNATRLKCYCDGVQKTLSLTGTIPASIPATGGTNHWMFGKDYSSRFDSGSIRCAGFWSDVKTQADATLLYNSGTPPKYSDLSTLHPKSSGNFFLLFP